MRLSRTVAAATAAAALAGSLALAAGTAAAGHEPAPRTPSHAAPARPQLAQTAGTLQRADQVLRPVSALLTEVLRDGARLPEAQADRRVAEAVRALDTVRTATPARASGHRTAADSAALVQRAADRLEERVRALADAAGTGDRARVDTTADAALTGSMDLLAALVAGGNLPTAHMPGLPTHTGPKAHAKVPTAPEPPAKSGPLGG
ncbi:hypothetical protein [Streptomyces sulphureus]|uniref:hypothetical protein n=1 Tax=Streptomyces sulphureus TaxID=47758 RepID=UPI0003672E83|nr:hypothetical protein [Streptomyces sulphureus]